MRMIHEIDDTARGRVIATRTVQPVLIYPVVWSLLKVKKLRLETWMKGIERDGYLIDKYQAFSGFNGYPELGNGWFMGHEKYREERWIFSWFQVNGKAYWHIDLDRDFEYSLSLLSHKPLRYVELEAMKVMAKAKMLTKKQIDILRAESDTRELRDIQREYYWKTMFRLDRRVKDSK